MLIPELPQPWLAQTMRKKFPDLCAWTEELGQQVFGGPADVDDAFLTTRTEGTTSKGGKSSLPWEVPYNSGIVGVGGVFLGNVADSIPVVGQLRRNTRMRQHGGKAPGDELQSSNWQSITTIGSLVASVGLFLGYMFQQGYISFPENPEPEKRNGTGLDSFGDAGSALSIYANHMDAESHRERGVGAQGAPVAEVDVDIGPNDVRVTEIVS